MVSQDAGGHVAGTLAPSAHEETFPPFDSANFSSQLVWLAITFGLLYLLMSKVALPRVAGILVARKAKIDADLAGAAKSQKDASDAAAIHEKTLAEGKAKAIDLGRAALAESASQAAARRADLEAQLNAKLAEAEKHILAKKAEAMANVGAAASETAHAILQHITGKPADADAVAAALVALKV